MAGGNADPMLTELPRYLFEIPCDFFVCSVLLAQQLFEDGARLCAPTCHFGLQPAITHDAETDLLRPRRQAKYRSGPLMVHFRSA